MTTLERPFTIKTAADHLSVSENHIRRLVTSGRLGHFKIGRLIRIPQSAMRALEEAMAHGDDNPEPEPELVNHQRPWFPKAVK